jgi:hypothetical protein
MGDPQGINHRATVNMLYAGVYALVIEDESRGFFPSALEIPWSCLKRRIPQDQVPKAPAKTPGPQDQKDGPLPTRLFIADCELRINELSPAGIVSSDHPT